MKPMLLCVAILAVFSSGAPVGGGPTTTALIPHDPIWIGSNDEFTSENGVISGKGTPDSPYVIEGWVFSGTPSGIGVAHTDAHFVIRGCRFAQISESAAISLSEVSNGRVEDCIVDGTAAGQCIALYDSASCAIRRCNLTNTAQPAVIALWGCTRITVAENTLRSSPRWTSWAGVALWGTTESTVERSVIGDCGLAVALNRYVEKAADSIGNTIAANSMSGSETSDIGIEPTSVGNLFFHNNLASKGKVSSAAPKGSNKWDNGLEGNFWGQTGWDPDGDGFSNTAYQVGMGDVDRHPLMRPWRDTVVIMGIHFTGLDEVVTIRNCGQAGVDLEGWKLESLDAKTRAVRDSVTVRIGGPVPVDGMVRIHSGAAATATPQEVSCLPLTDLYGGWQNVGEGRTVWDDYGGIVRLLDDQGQVVDELEYGWWMGS